MAEDLHWIVRDERVALTATSREDFLERWERYGSDPIASMTMLAEMPPVTRDKLEAVWSRVTANGRMFDVRLVEDGRCVGESVLTGIRWPHGSADLGMFIYEPEDRAKGYGAEASHLTAAYGFDGLGLHRIKIVFMETNQGLARILHRFGGRIVGVEREAVWAFGGYKDLAIGEVLRHELDPHPATAHLRQTPSEHRREP